MISIDDFCDEHRACKDGREWAIASCVDMLAAWQTLKPQWLIWVATRKGVLADSELRLFAVFCAMSVEHLLTDQRSRDAIEVAERFANGEATREELAAAWAAAAAAASASASAAYAASASAAYAARAAARGAAWAASDAASAAAGAAAFNLAQAAQSAWLRENTKPNFGVEVTS